MGSLRKKLTVSQTKDLFGYVKKGPCCENCAFFKSNITDPDPYGYTYETKKRCSFHGFACGKQSWCEEHIRLQKV